MQYTNDNDKERDGLCYYPTPVVLVAAQLVEKYAPVAARPQGSSGWWVYTNAVAFALGNTEFQTKKEKIERAAKFLKISPMTLYNDPILTT
ncbi:MAG: hypothetical protein BGO21_08630 [Dyadobacter sp. 50-39]|uniref:hypothetical protein n=1 Tax=Dyadobacter sp. 50-39 TaxID=1895756 RepID=UPI000966ED1D|nr:hypothetical protein [Dyadobacter sp. 50-39]OJV19312.1 MAG: hypothetical protein BGO21_08630 [Dyadobacter sp. 50-39]